MQSIIDSAIDAANTALTWVIAAVLDLLALCRDAANHGDAWFLILVILGTTSLVWILIAAFRGGHEVTDTFKPLERRGELRVLRMKLTTITKLGLSTTMPVIVRAVDSDGKALGKTVRLALRYRTTGGEMDALMHPDTLDALGIENPGKAAKLVIRKVSSQTLPGLWNHPDTGIRVGTRIAIVLTIVQQVISIPMTLALNAVSAQASTKGRLEIISSVPRPTSTCLSTDTSDDAVKAKIIADDIARYDGNCPCPDYEAGDGSRCGDRASNAVRCLPGQVTPTDVAKYRSEHQCTP